MISNFSISFAVASSLYSIYWIIVFVLSTQGYHYFNWGKYPRYFTPFLRIELITNVKILIIIRHLLVQQSQALREPQPYFSAAPAAIQSKITWISSSGNLPCGGMLLPSVWVPNSFWASRLLFTSPGITTGLFLPLVITDW
jgi:hypothetical protein